MNVFLKKIGIVYIARIITLFAAWTVIKSNSINSHEVIVAITRGYRCIIIPPLVKDSVVERVRSGYYPLVVALHGKSLHGKNIKKLSRYGTVAAVEGGLRIPAYVVAPQCPVGAGWSPERLSAVIDYMLERYHVDSNRVSVIGMSMGGYGAFDLVGTYPERISAGISLCGGGHSRLAEGISHVPMWAIHGKSDDIIPASASRQIVEAVKVYNRGMCFYTEVPRINHGRLAESFTHKKLYYWLISHDKSNRRLSTPDGPELPSYDLSDFKWGVAIRSSGKRHGRKKGRHAARRKGTHHAARKQSKKY